MSGSGTFGELARETARRLAEAGIESARLDARLLLGHLTGLDAAALLARRDDPVGPEVIDALRGLADRRAAHEPMAHILGEREFWSLPLRVTADTLVPRPDTETLVEAALGWRESVPDCREPAVLDLGTGTGCILLALLSEWEDASGVGIDISESALAVAAENAKRLDLAARARFLVSDWGRGLDARFDVIVSNPPYIPENEIAGLTPEVVRFDPRGALSGGADGLDAYRVLAGQLPRLMAPKAVVFLEIGWDQSDGVTNVLRQGGLSVLSEHKDLAGRPRCLAVGDPSF